MLFMTSAGVHDKFHVTMGIAVRRVFKERASVFPLGVSHVSLMLEVPERGGLQQLVVSRNYAQAPR